MTALRLDASRMPYTPPASPVPAPTLRRDAGGPVRLLVVDDEETIRLALGRFLRLRGFEVETASSAAAALEQLRRQPVAVAICDVRMPGMSGLEFVPAALALDPDLAVVMLTAVNDAPTASGAFGSGACDYLVKPVELVHLHDAIERALQRRELSIARREMETRIRTEVAERTAELESEKTVLRTLTVSIAETLINAMEAKDIYLRGHSQRVAELAASVADALGLDVDTIEAVRLAGRLHDVGKIGIREDVLNKPGALTAEEFEHVQDHVRIGMEILAPLRHLGVALDFVHHHHEHVDGRGYPQGLAGDAISIGGRILAAADAFDALTSRRAYREPMEQLETLAYLRGEVGRLVDARVYDALCTVIRRNKALVFIDDVPA